jgi:VWFA-related protein
LISPHAIASQQAPSISQPSAVHPQASVAQPDDVRTVYVVVTEKDGTPIPDLRLEDFSVLENREPQQVLEVSSASSAPLVMCVLVDSSGSERQNVSRNKNLEILSRFLATVITQSDNALIVTFNEDFYRLTGITNSLSELRAGLGKIARTQPRGSTALYDGMYACAGAMSKKQNDRKTILVFSDFEDNTSHYSLEKTVAHVRETGVSVFAFVESEPSASKKSRKRGWETATQIAHESGGLALSFESPRDLEAALGHLQLFLRTSYVLKYRATGRPDKAKVVPLKIDVQRKGVSIFAPQSRPPATP